MNYIIENNPDIIDSLKENFVDDGDYTRDIFADELKQAMARVPDRILVIVSYDNDKPVGSLIAHIPFNRNFVFIDQAFNMSGEHKDGFVIFEEWVKSKGLNRVRIETGNHRVEAAVAKRYGFKEYSVVMEKTL